MAPHPQWMVCNDDGHVVVNAVSGELAQATAMSAGRRVAVIVPAGEALVTESDAPAKSAAKLAQVIPYALEERVADEIENLHFAIGERDAGHRPRAGRGGRARAHRRVAGGAARRRASNPQAIYSEATLLPAMPGQMIAPARRRHAHAAHRRCSAAGDAGALHQRRLRDGARRRRRRRSPDSNRRRSGLLLYAGHDEWQAHQLKIDALRDRFTGVKVQLLPSGPLSVLAPAAASGDAVNLLQGALAVASPLRARLALLARGRGARPLRCCACTSVRATSSSSRCARVEATLDAGIQDAFRAAMPGQQNATNARRRVEQRLAEIRGGGGGGTLLPALSAIANARSAAPTATIEGITFRDGTLDLRINAPDAASLDAIGQQLRAASWQADIMGGSANGDSYRGRLQVRKAGA